MSQDSVNRRDLCSLADVIARVPGYFPGDDPETDAILQQLISQESRDFVEYTGREIISQDSGDEPSERLFELTRFNVEQRELAIGDATEITAVELRDQDGTVLQTLTSAAWVELPRIRDDWWPITTLAFPPRVADPAQLRATTLAHVTGSWGFPSVPDTVTRAVSTLSLFRYLNEVASAGTKLADIVNRENFNLASSLRAAFDARDRLRVPRIG